VFRVVIRQAPRRCVRHEPFAFDRQEGILAEGIPSENLHLDEMARDTLTSLERGEREALFPDLRRMAPRGVEGAGRTGRHCLRRRETALVA